MCIVLIFGAPVIEPQGKTARMMSEKEISSSQLARDGGNEMKKRRVLFQIAELFDSNAAEFADSAEVVAQKVNNHHVFGAVFFGI